MTGRAHGSPSRTTVSPGRSEPRPPRQCLRTWQRRAGEIGARSPRMALERLTGRPGVRPGVTNSWGPARAVDRWDAGAGPGPPGVPPRPATDVPLRTRTCGRTIRAWSHARRPSGYWPRPDGFRSSERRRTKFAPCSNLTNRGVRRTEQPSARWSATACRRRQQRHAKAVRPARDPKFARREAPTTPSIRGCSFHSRRCAASGTETSTAWLPSRTAATTRAQASRRRAANQRRATAGSKCLIRSSAPSSR